MSENKTWSMKDMDTLWSKNEPKSAQGSEPSSPATSIAVAVMKPAHHNSIFKAFVLLGGGSVIALLGFLGFSLINASKAPEENVATTPETSDQRPTAQNDGWEAAAQQSASEAGAGINIPDSNKNKKPEEATTPSLQKNDPKATDSKVAPVPVVVNTSSSPVTAPVAPKPASVAYSPPKPILITNPPSNQEQTRKIGEQAAKIKELEQKIAKPEAKTVASLPLVSKGSVKPIEFKPTNPPVAPKPEARPIVSLPLAVKPIPPVTPIARPTNPQVVVATNPTPAVAPISWEQASAAGIYGGDSSVTPSPVGGLGVSPGSVTKDSGKDTGKQRSNYEGALSPTLLLPAGTSAKGHTVAPYVGGLGTSTLSIALDEAIELASGYSFPVGTTINFDVSVRDNGSVVAISKNADIKGVEIQIPDAAISLAGADNGLLITKEVSTGGDELTRADIASSIWGAAAGVGRAILQSGSQTTTNTGLLGTTTQTNNGNPNTIGGVIDGAFTPLATNAQQRAQQTAERIRQRSRINVIDVNTKVKIFVNAPVQIQIPVSGDQVGRTVTEEEEPPPPRLITSNSARLPVSEKPLPPPNQKGLLVQPAPLPQVQSPVVVPVTNQPTVTPLLVSPPKTRISRPW
jgi:hypothetical protein